MAINLKGRSFLTLEDFTPAEIRYLLDLGHDLKAKRRAGSSVLPARSTRRTSIPVWSSTAVLPPTAAIRPLRTNRAWASGLFRSRVRMVPFSKRMSMRFLLFSQFTAAGRVPYPGGKLHV